MSARSGTALLMVSVLGAVLATSSARAACKASERPPVPTQVKWFPLGESAMYFQWAGRRNDYFDVAVAEKPSGQIKENIAGGLRGQWEKTYSGLKENTEYEVTIRSRTEARTEGCVSASAVTLVARTAKKVDADACRRYSARAVAQFNDMQRKQCPTDGARWNRSQNFHYQWCLPMRARGQTLDVSEQKARDDLIQSCRPAVVDGGGFSQTLLARGNELLGKCVRKNLTTQDTECPKPPTGIGDGECTHFVQLVLKNAGAPDPTFNTSAKDYNWGNKVSYSNLLNEIRPGDVLQFWGSRFQKDASNYWGTSTQHSALVLSKSGDMVTVLEQNSGNLRLVKKNTYNFAWPHTGDVFIYRPGKKGQTLKRRPRA